MFAAAEITWDAPAVSTNAGAAGYGRRFLENAPERPWLAHEPSWDRQAATWIRSGMSLANVTRKSFVTEVLKEHRKENDGGQGVHGHEGKRARDAGRSGH